MSVRQIIISSLKAEGYRLIFDGSTGEYYTIAGHTPGDGTDHAVWVSWEFDGTIRCEKICEGTS